MPKNSARAAREDHLAPTRVSSAKIRPGVSRAGRDGSIKCSMVPGMITSPLPGPTTARSPKPRQKLNNGGPLTGHLKYANTPRQLPLRDAARIPGISRIKVPSPSFRRPRRLLITGFLALAAALASYVAVQAYLGQSPGAAVLPVPPPAVPVQIATVERRDVPLYLPGLGTVQAYNTVVVRTQVDGQLQQVAFTEGQKVKAGDLLAQIDPRPFQANYDQAVARKLEDRGESGQCEHQPEALQ